MLVLLFEKIVARGRIILYILPKTVHYKPLGIPKLILNLAHEQHIYLQRR